MDFHTEDTISFEKEIQAIDITNDCMFAHIMKKPDVCMELLECLLPSQKICKIHYYQVEEQTVSSKATPQTQKTLSEAFDKRGIRLDAYLDDHKTIYNIEMQTTTQAAIAKRARLYQAHMDIHQLKRGHSYDLLKPSFVIFICTFDPFGYGDYQYTFRSLCTTNDHFELGDETQKVFFNTTGQKGSISSELRELLSYMNDTKAFDVQNSKNPLIHKIEKEVSLAKMDDDWRRMYMTYAIHQRDAELRGISIGEKRGLALGEKRGLALGEKRGLALGEKRGLALGAQNAKVETATKMLLSGMPISEISKWLDLSLQEVQALKDGLNTPQ